MQIQVFLFVRVAWGGREISPGKILSMLRNIKRNLVRKIEVRERHLSMSGATDGVENGLCSTVHSFSQMLFLAFITSSHLILMRRYLSLG